MIDREFEQDMDGHSDRQKAIARGREMLRKYGESFGYAEWGKILAKRSDADLLDEYRNLPLASSNDDEVATDQVQAKYSRSDAMIAAMTSMGWINDEAARVNRLRQITDKLRNETMVIVVGSPIQRYQHWFLKEMSEWPLHISMDFGDGPEMLNVERREVPSKLFIEQTPDSKLLYGDQPKGIDVSRFTAWQGGHSRGKSAAVAMGVGIAAHSLKYNTDKHPDHDYWAELLANLYWSEDGLKRQSEMLRRTVVTAEQIRDSITELGKQVTQPPVLRVTPANQPASKRGKRFQNPHYSSKQFKYSQKRSK